jgi:predicted NUDIX family NTP pyrophosphohydrolase
MTKKSAGLLMYRHRAEGLQVLLVHMGGPFWEKKDEGAWSIPKGEYGDDEETLAAARREFEEETGLPSAGPFTALTPVRQSSVKTVSAWAFEGDCDPAQIKSNTFSLQWPPGSGQWRQYPEADRAEWFTIPNAKEKIVKGQVALLEEFEALLGESI